MPQSNYNETLTEAVALFHESGSLQLAVDELLLHGFDRAELSVLANKSAITAKLGDGSSASVGFEDDPDVPRMAYMSGDSLGDAQGAIIGAAAYLPAILASVMVTTSGGTLFAAIVAGIAAGAAGAFVGAAAARYVSGLRTKHIEEHLRDGGLLLWVRTHNKEREAKALDILQRNSGADVHLHVLPEPRLRAKSIETHRPLLSLRPVA